MARVIVVPGLAVHAYAEPPVEHLRDNGHDARLLQPPAWRGVDHDLERYGRKLRQVPAVHQPFAELSSPPSLTHCIGRADHSGGDLCRIRHAP
jgi:hypothetical protein